MHPTVRALIDAWHWSYVDLRMAFDGISMRALHERPAAGVLSVAEIAAHTVYSEASIVLRYLLGVPKGQWGEDFMLREPYGWPPHILKAPYNEELRALDACQIEGRWLQAHERFLTAANTLDLPPDHRFSDEWSDAAPDVQTRLRFAAYHVAYHVGQIYTNRHLLGEQTPDN